MLQGFFMQTSYYVLGRNHISRREKNALFWSTRPTHSHGRYWSLFSNMLSVRPSVSKSRKKQNNFQARIAIATGGTVGSGQVDHWWHTCLVFLSMQQKRWWKTYEIVSQDLLCVAIFSNWRYNKMNDEFSSHFTCSKLGASLSPSWPWPIRQLWILIKAWQWPKFNCTFPLLVL